MNFSRCKTQPNATFIINYLSNLGIKLMKTQKDLGIIINSSLKWNDQISHILTKANNVFYLLKRNGNLYPNPTIRRVLFSIYIKPILTYCSTAFYVSRSNLKLLDSFQFRILKWISKDYHSDYKDLLIRNCFMPMGFIWFI